MNLFDFYHQQTKRLKEVVKESIPVENWPDSWRTTYIKSYPRFEVISLPKPSPLTISLSACIVKRFSNRNFECKVTLEQISSLLYFSIGEKDSEFDNKVGRRMYPSAGSLYPLEFYLINFKDIVGLPAGVYHYNLEKHGLTILEKRSFTKEDREQISPDPVAYEAQFAILGTAVFTRSTEKYGERAYKFANLELGAVTQNFSLCATALEISTVNVGGFYDEEIETMLSIDGMSEKFLHSMFFG